ncbi:MAG: hypothetical protein WCJ02_10405, partial [bacterium]
EIIKPIVDVQAETPHRKRCASKLVFPPLRQFGMVATRQKWWCHVPALKKPRSQAKGRLR